MLQSHDRVAMHLSLGLTTCPGHGWIKVFHQPHIRLFLIHAHDDPLPVRTHAGGGRPLGDIARQSCH